MKSSAQKEVARDLETFRKNKKGRRSRPQSASHSRPHSATQRTPPTEYAQLKGRAATGQGASACDGGVLTAQPSESCSHPSPLTTGVDVASPSVASRVLYEGKVEAQEGAEEAVEEKRNQKSSSSKVQARKFKPPPSTIYSEDMLTTNAPTRRKLQKGRSSKRGTFFGAVPKTFSPTREMQERAKEEVSVV